MAATRIAGLKPDGDKCSDKLHLLPCEIKYSGEANVSEYFEPCIKEINHKNSSEEQDIIKLASFRGRPLKGKEINVPANYQGLVLKEERKPYTEDEERTLVPQMSFAKFTYWNLDTQPSQNDNLFKAFNWINISKVLHAQTDEDKEIPQQTQTDR